MIKPSFLKKFESCIYSFVLIDVVTAQWYSNLYLCCHRQYFVYYSHLISNMCYSKYPKFSLMVMKLVVMMLYT